MSNSYAVVTVLIFAVVAIMHLVRIINGWSVAIGPHNIPMSASWAGLVVSALLALWGVVQAINNVFVGEIPRDRKAHLCAGGHFGNRNCKATLQVGSLGLEVVMSSIKRLARATATWLTGPVRLVESEVNCDKAVVPWHT